jgi:ectoine hydroxylase-related dioxygenase (phytanoyl-CoA dioxygenase family)
VEVPLKAGQAVVFSNATIHGATDNQSNARRLAATLLVCNKGAQWQIIYNDSSKTDKPIERYHLDLNTFIHMPKNGKPAAAALKETMNYTFPEISQKEFNARAGTESFGAHRIFSWLSEWLNARKK